MTKKRKHVTRRHAEETWLGTERRSEFDEDTCTGCEAVALLQSPRGKERCPRLASSRPRQRIPPRLWAQSKSCFFKCWVGFCPSGIGVSGKNGRGPGLAGREAHIGSVFGSSTILLPLHEFFDFSYYYLLWNGERIHFFFFFPLNLSNLVHHCRTDSYITHTCLFLGERFGVCLTAAFN